MNELAERLYNFDKLYFDYIKETAAYHNLNIKETARHLATYCYDAAFTFNEESYKILKDIKRHFGDSIADMVLVNLFLRRYDT